MSYWLSMGVAPLLAAATMVSTVEAQQAASPPTAGKPVSLSITISDDPRIVDGTKLLPEPFTKTLTIAFDKRPLADVVRWLRDDLKLKVVVNEDRFGDARITDQLTDEPLTLLLGRLASVGVGWFLEEGVLHLAPVGDANSRLVLVRYTLGPLIDTGYDATRVIETLRRETVGTWTDFDSSGGSTVLVGDVLFVRQRQSAQIEIAALLSALERHGRRTLLFDPPWRTPLLETLKKRVKIQFDDIPLGEAIRQLGAALGTDLRIDPRVPSGDVERAPVKYATTDQTLSTILSAISKTPLGVEIRSGAIWVIPRTAETVERTTAVYDVRDLCLDFDESNALREAIRSQVRGPWDGSKGMSGSISFPAPGVLVVRQMPSELDAISALLEDFRFALRASKPREAAGSDLKKVELRIYRVPSEMAIDVEKLLVEHIAPQSWQVAAPAQPGTIQRAMSQPRVEKADNPAGAGVVTQSYSVLLIRQTVENHREIAALLQRLQAGDPPMAAPAASRKEGIGGFGRGYFSVKP